jgi:hypothetical protein
MSGAAMPHATTTRAHAPRRSSFTPPARRWLRLAALLVPIVAAGGAAGTSETRGPDLPSERETWLRVDSAHFVLFSDAPEDRTLDLANQLEWFREVLAKAYARLDLDFARPTFIYVLDGGSWTTCTKAAGLDPDLVAGWFVPRADGNYAAINGSRGASSGHSIYHEYVHALLHNNLPGLPLWFEEGLGDCYGTFRVDQKVARIGEPLEGPLRWLRERTLLPLADLFAEGGSSKSLNAGDRSLYVHFEGWAFVHYLLWDRPGGRDLLVRFVDRLLDGGEPEAAFTDVFGMTPEKFQVDLLKYVQGRRFSSGVVHTNDLKLETRARAVPMKRAEVLWRIGDLLVHIQRIPTGLPEACFHEALRIEPASAAARVGLGYLHERAAEYDAAAAEYEKALAADPEDARANFRYGESLLHRYQAGWRGPDVGGASGPAIVERMRYLLGRSISADPTFAEPYVDFGATYLLDGLSPAAGIRALEQARAMLPARSDVVVDLIQLELARGDRAKAQDLADHVLARLHDPDALAAARRAIVEGGR